MKTPLSVIEYTIIILYFAVIIILGIVASRRQSWEGFLIADRNLKTLANAMSIVASKIGAGVIMTLIALVYLYGYSAIWYFVGASAGYIVFIFFAGSLKEMSSRENFYTLSDYFFFKFGRTVGFVSASIVSVYMLLVLLMQLIGGAKAVSHLSGISFSASFLLIIITIFIYIVVGGFKAVVKTDSVQLIVMVFIAGLFGLVMTNVFDRHLISTALAVEKQLPLKFSVSFFLGGVLMPFLSADLWQRVYAASDLKSVQRSLTLAVFIYFLFGVLLCIIGLAISVRLTDIDPDLALLEGFTVLLPSGLVGLGLVFFLAAIMSSADSYLFALVSVVIHDFVARVQPMEKAHTVKLFRYTVAVPLLICYLVSFWLKSIIDTTFIVLAFGSVVAISVIASWGFKECRPRTIVSGMVVGVAGTIVVIISKPIDATLGLNSIVLTIGGLILEYLFTLITGKIKQEAPE